MKIRRPPTEPPYRLLNHTADIALQVRGVTLEDLFANAATGMFAQMVDLRKVPLQVQRVTTVEAEDNEALLVAWLSELLYLRDAHGEAYSRFTVSFPEAGRLQGRVEGGRWGAFDRPVKAVTFHGLKIERGGGGFQTTIIFDV